MSKSYSQVMKQIDALKTEAEKLRRKEVDGVIGRIREAVSFYKLTAADLGLTVKRAGAPKAAAKRGRGKAKSTAPAVVKYRDDQGRGWVGRGKRPQWLRDALAAGKSLQDFAVK